MNWVQNPTEEFAGVMERQCGSCTACCDGWLSGTIEGHRMKPGTPCLHCTKSGCAIYARRPVAPCRNFICGWLAEDSPLPESLKPDKCGAIIILDRPWNGKKAVIAIPVGEKIPPQTLSLLMAQTRRSSVPLVYVENIAKDGDIVGRKVLGYGPPSFVDEVRTMVTPKDILQL